MLGFGGSGTQKVGGGIDEVRIKLMSSIASFYGTGSLQAAPPFRMSGAWWVKEVR